MTDLSILIPSRNEMFLSRTVQDILEHSEADTEIIVVLDGQWAEPQLEIHPKVTVVYAPEVIGQRAATNLAAKLAQGKYVMKVDAHCAFDQGFDRKLLEDMRDDWTVVPIMRNLHVFNWVCPNGHSRYQGPSGVCTECGEPTTMDVVWIAKKSPQSTAYCFDPEPHFQYDGAQKKRVEGKGDFTETMSLQGSCFMLTKERYFALGMNDEEWGSWGSQGIEIAVRTWLSGGKCICNHKTWYAHCFRTQGGSFGFPYPMSGKQVEHAKDMVRKTFYTGNWDKAIHPLSWLVKKFWPVPGWKEEDLAKITKEDKELTVGIVYYTDNKLDTNIMSVVQNQLTKSANGHKIVSVSLEPLDFGHNIVINLERGYLTMFKQILAGIEALDTDIVFLAEHDILYHPSHFDFIPTRKDIYYYNTNVWKLRMTDGHCLHYDCQQTSGLCAYRELLLQHYRERVKRTEEKFAELGNTRAYRDWIRRAGFEAGTNSRAERIDNFKAESWQSEYPNIDIRHDKNLTPNRWNKSEFRNQRYTRGWAESDEIKGWGVTKNRVMEFLNDLSSSCV